MKKLQFGIKVASVAALVGFLAFAWDKPMLFGAWTEILMGGAGLLAIEYSNDLASYRK